MGRVVSPTPIPLSSGRVGPALVASYDMHGRAVGLFYTQPTGQQSEWARLDFSERSDGAFGWNSNETSWGGRSATLLQNAEGMFQLFYILFVSQPLQSIGIHDRNINVI